jgi:tetratricopeptide (TPR) repeat protein
VRYRLHPGVADTIHADTPVQVKTAVDAELAAYWRAMFDLAREREGRQRAGWLVVQAAFAAAPYLLRLHDWRTASVLLDQALLRDRSPGTVAAALPHLRAIAAASTGTDRELIDQGGLARAVARIDPVEGERRLRAVLDQAIDRKLYQVGSAVAGDLANLLSDRGRYPDALGVADRKAELTRLAGLGAWNQLSDAALRLQILALAGDPEPVFDEVQRLRERMHRLPDQPGDDEVIEPWNVREAILDIGRQAAGGLGRWQEALDLNAENLTSTRRRGAGPHELASTAFNDYGPLMELGRLPEADRLLQACQEQFELAGATGPLGKVLSARADVADKQGHPESAIRLEQVAVRYSYASGDTDSITVSHYNLAGYQKHAGRAAGVWLPHRLAAALLSRLTGSGRLQTAQRTLSRNLTDPATATAVPGTVGELRAAVERVDGVRLGDLLHSLQPDPSRQQGALDEILHTARTMPPEQAFDVQQDLDRWEPVLAAIVIATTGDQAARQQVDEQLAGHDDSVDWAALFQVLRRILAGERDPETLLPSLDPVDTAIATRLLDALAGRLQLQPPGSEPAPTAEQLITEWEPVLAGIVAASTGDQAAQQEVTEFFDGVPDSSGWTAVVAVLRRVFGGERDPESLLPGLDAVETAIVIRLLDALAGRLELNPRSDVSAADDQHQS